MLRVVSAINRFLHESDAVDRLNGALGHDLTDRFPDHATQDGSLETDCRGVDQVIRRLIRSRQRGSLQIVEQCDHL